MLLRFNWFSKLINFYFSNRIKFILFLLTSLFILETISLNLLLGQPLAQGKDKFLGAATSYFIFREFDKYWNQLTPGNEGKWGSVTSVRGVYNWSSLDFLYNFAIKRGIAFKHHTLVWGSQQPNWISSLDTASQRVEVENWIRMVCERYPKLSMIDVVNEPFHSVPSYKNALGGDGVTGWDWVITAFQLARKYAPSDVKLLINEYNVLHSNSVTTNYINLVNLLKERGLIDGIGIQGHYFEFRSDYSSPSQYVYDINTIKNNLNRLTALGLPVYITEFDIDEPIDSIQLAQYKIYFPIFWNNPGVKGITFWGYYESDVWSSHPNTFLIKADGTERPALVWLRNYISSPLPPNVLSPIAQSNVQRNPLLIWTSSSEATSYRVQLSTSSNFNTTIIDTVIVDTTLQLKILNANTLYYWRVCSINNYGSSDYSSGYFITGESILSINNVSKLPEKFILYQNYPNPFNPFTTIKFYLPINSKVKITLLNLLGQEVKLISDSYYNEGEHLISIDASELASGVYYYKVETNKFFEIKKMVLIK